jgi:hypothetical protein
VAEVVASGGERLFPFGFSKWNEGERVEEMSGGGVSGHGLVNRGAGGVERSRGGHRAPGAAGAGAWQPRGARCLSWSGVTRAGEGKRRGGRRGTGLGRVGQLGQKGGIGLLTQNNFFFFLFSNPIFLKQFQIQIFGVENGIFKS